MEAKLITTADQSATLSACVYDVADAAKRLSEITFRSGVWDVTVHRLDSRYRITAVVASTDVTILNHSSGLQKQSGLCTTLKDAMSECGMDWCDFEADYRAAIES